jgi:hypothetical protein
VNSEATVTELGKCLRIPGGQDRCQGDKDPADMRAGGEEKTQSPGRRDKIFKLA